MQRAAETTRRLLAIYPAYLLVGLGLLSCVEASPGEEIAIEEEALASLGARPYKALGAGWEHSCGVLSDGTVKCWGDNTHGQLGNGTTTDSLTPVAVSSLGNVISIKEGSHSNCALLGDGTVKCWGQGANGQLGNGSTASSSVPVSVSGLSGVSFLGRGLSFTCAVMAFDGTVKCWGLNTFGQLGDGTTTNRSTPVNVSGLYGATSISGSENHACAVLGTGQVKCWGLNSFGQLGDGTTTNRMSPVLVSGINNAVQVGTYFSNTCALLSTGQVKCWGLNTVGQLGNGNNTNSSVPVLVSGVSDATYLDVGADHSCVTRSDGFAKCWGHNGEGDLGNNSTVSSNVPVDVYNLTGAVQVVSGAHHSCALGSGGTIRCWGDNSQGQLGDNTTTDRLSPITVSGIINMSSGHEVIAAKGWHACALTPIWGMLKCWGRNDFGQLGDGTTTTRNTPAYVTGLFGVVQVSGGYEHTCALLSNGTVKCWGYNGYGQLGTGNTTNRTIPDQISGLSGVVEISAGGYHTCARRYDGTVQCWGNNWGGQIGDGTSSNTRLSPTTVSGLSGAVQIASGGWHTCALLSEGTGRCWGDNYSGQLGDGTTTQRSTPVSTGGFYTSATQISAGDRQSCVLLADGTAQCWGDNDHGQVGNNTTTDQYYPTDVYGLLSYSGAAISTGGRQSCALQVDGSAWCWGYNDYMGSRLFPFQISGFSQLSQISASEDFVCGSKADGTTWCWGDNAYGQLGDGTYTNRPSPVQVTGL